MSVSFLDLDRIIICLSLNMVEKTYYLFNKTLNVLTQLDYNAEIQNIVFSTIEKNKSIKSHYNNLFSDTIFDTYFLPKIPEENDSLIFTNRKINYDSLCLQEKILFNKDLNQKNEFILFFKKYLIHLAKNGLYYQIYDFFNYTINLNKGGLYTVVVNIIKHRKKIKTVY